MRVCFKRFHLVILRDNIRPSIIYRKVRIIHESHIYHESNNLPHLSIPGYKCPNIFSNIFPSIHFKITRSNRPLDIKSICTVEEFIVIRGSLCEFHKSIHKCRSDNHATSDLILTLYIKKFFKFDIFETNTLFLNIPPSE